MLLPRASCLVPAAAPLTANPKSPLVRAFAPALVAAGEHFVALDFERSGVDSAGIYLIQNWTKVEKTEEEKAAEDAASTAVTEAAASSGKLVIGAPDEGKVEKAHSLLLMPEKVVVPLVEGAELPTFVQNAVDAVIAHTGVALKDQTAAFVEDFEAKESKFARSLVQLPVEEGQKVPCDPTQWKCMESGETENLWLNLSTGFIGSGRKNWDGTGGNGAAERHFEANGSKYPLAVKLGTITKDGADIFSYDKSENDMVLDPLLAEHLAHWGIDIMKQEKTEKTMAELQVSLNMECVSKFAHLAALPPLPSPPDAPAARRPTLFVVGDAACSCGDRAPPALTQAVHELIRNGVVCCAVCCVLWWFRYDWSKITEGKESLVPLVGPGYVGIANLGNSCYVNSVVQSLFSTPEFKARYADAADKIFHSAPANLADDLSTQLAKLGSGS